MSVLSRRALLMGAAGMAPLASASGRTDADRWVRPGSGDAASVWGLRKGIRVGIWPAGVEGPGDGGPRGLLRVGYPAIGGGRLPGLINFIAVEPVVGGRRGFSELEVSGRDGRPGRVFWTGSADHPADPRDGGTITEAGGIERLAVTVYMEPFANGARPVVDLTFRADRPDEVGLTVRSAPGSARMDACVLTATMGNYGRLRRLWLRDGPVEARALWPGFDGAEFTGDAFFAADRLPRAPGGDLLIAATSDEADPHAVPPDPAAPGWAYRGGFPLTQYWRKPKGDERPGLRVRVNGRVRYWASHNAIPGGLAFENFELAEPFHEGQTVAFGLTRRPPRDLTRVKAP